MHRPVTKSSLLLFLFALSPCLLAADGPRGAPHPLPEARKHTVDPFDFMLTGSDQELYRKELECVKKDLKAAKPPIPKPKPGQRFISWDTTKGYFADAVRVCEGVTMQKFAYFMLWNDVATRMGNHEIHDSLVAHWPMGELFSDEFRESYAEQSEALTKCENHKGCRAKKSGEDWEWCLIACEEDVRKASSYDADLAISSFFYYVVDIDLAPHENLETWMSESKDACRRYNKAQGLDENRCSEDTTDGNP